MDTYSLLREIADSWVLLLMFVFFVAVGLWAFRPGGSKTYDDISRIPLRNDTVPSEGQSRMNETPKGLKDV